jgi:hypothetical protein
VVQKKYKLLSAVAQKKSLSGMIKIISAVVRKINQQYKKISQLCVKIAQWCQKKCSVAKNSLSGMKKSLQILVIFANELTSTHLYITCIAGWRCSIIYLITLEFDSNH